MRQLFHAYFAPAILDDATRLYRGHRKRLRFHFEAARFDDGPFEDVFLVELDNGPVWLDGARGDVLNLYLAAKQATKRQIDLAL